MNRFSLFKVFIIVFLFIFFFNIIKIVTSQQMSQNKNSSTEYAKTIIGYAGWWWLFFSLGIFLIILGILVRNLNDVLSRFLLYGGLAVVFFSIFLAQILYVLPLIPVIKGIDIYLCEEVANLNTIQYVSCIFSGMTPKSDIYSFIIWAIFLFVLPLSILIGLFWEFTTPFIIENPNVRKVIAFASALIAYRFLMAYLFVEFISVGLGGIALFFVNILIFGWAVNGIRRLFRFTETVRRMREVQNLAQLERLMRMRDEIYAAWQAAIREGNVQLADQLRQQLDNIDRQINRLRRVGS